MKPDPRTLELCQRLTSVGSPGLKLSASEFHELADFVFNLDDKPIVVCLCGSTRFGAAFQEANLRETLAGKIVLSIGFNMRSDTEIFGHMSPEELKKTKAAADELHKRKIDLADEILVLNVGGYIGQSTMSEINYALDHFKLVRFLEGGEMWSPV